MSLYPTEEIGRGSTDSQVLAHVAWHSLFWLVFANAVGVMLSILLLLPSLNPYLGEWSYGRWIMVHMNLELYGWTSIPMLGFLFRVYAADRGSVAVWCRPILWAWSAALGVGALSWLSGNSSGKLFLDWSGYSRILFPMAMGGLWSVLVFGLVSGWRRTKNTIVLSRIFKITGLGVLIAVPILLYIASSPGIYPAVNPDTGGPTGASQLESSLAIVAIMLLLPFGLAPRKIGRSRILPLSWIILLGEFVLCAVLGRAEISHHRPSQYLSLASLLLWIPLAPHYYAAFIWHPGTRRWSKALFAWWSLLLISGWILFLPGVLDHFKFTDGLVGHSFVAMAGFTSSLILFVMVQLMGKDGWIFNRSWSFYAWNASVLVYVVVMTIAGWHEGFDPSFTIVPGNLRNSLYVLRLVVGGMMLAASVEWLASAFVLLRCAETGQVRMPHVEEEVA